MRFLGRSLVVLVVVLGTAVSLSQLHPTKGRGAEPDRALINFVDVTEIENREVTLGTYFTLVDKSDNAIAPRSEGNAQIRFEDRGNGGPYESTNPQPPAALLTLTLLFDVSLYTPNLKGLADAALQFVNDLPANTRVSVMSFASKISAVTEFTSDKKKLADNIRRLVSRTVGDVPCFYDAAYAAIERIRSVISKGPRAIFMFSKGINFNSSGNPCSKKELEDITDFEYRGRAWVPIYTAFATQNRSPRAALSDLSRVTHGLAITGASFSELFDNARDAFSAIVYTEAIIHPKAGRQFFSLEAKFANYTSKYSNWGEFQSPCDCSRYVPPTPTFPPSSPGPTYTNTAEIRRPYVPPFRIVSAILYPDSKVVKITVGDVKNSAWVWYFEVYNRVNTLHIKTSVYLAVPPPVVIKLPPDTPTEGLYVMVSAYTINLVPDGEVSAQVTLLPTPTPTLTILPSATPTLGPPTKTATATTTKLPTLTPLPSPTPGPGVEFKTLRSENKDNRRYITLVLQITQPEVIKSIQLSVTNSDTGEPVAQFNDLPVLNEITLDITEWPRSKYMVSVQAIGLTGQPVGTASRFQLAFVPD